MKEALKFNDLDTYYKTDRRSLTGKYDVIQGVPRLGHVPFSLLGSFNKDNARSNESTKVCERGRIRGQGEGGHPDPEIRGGGLALRASVWSKNKGDPGPFPGSATGK